MVDVRCWGRGDTVPFVRVPTADDDKYSRGVVGVCTGSDAYPGAAVLGVEAAWRSGAGFVRYVGPARALVLARRPETVVTDVTTRADAWVIGSGTDASQRTRDEERAVRDLLAGTTAVVVDAGALELAPDAAAPLIVTPHARELARLRAVMGLRPGGSGDRAADAAETARELGRPVLLKGAATLLADPDGTVIGVEAGTGWLATAGTGDVLAGVIGALIAGNPGRPIIESAAAAVWLHGDAARRAAGVRGPGHPGHPIVALDVADALPIAIADLLR